MRKPVKMKGLTRTMRVVPAGPKKLATAGRAYPMPAFIRGRPRKGSRGA